MNAAGEIELSVAETNRIRAHLGLKPLKMASDGQTLSNGVSSFSQTTVKARGLGDVDPNEMSSADWVRRSRELEAKRKIAAAAASKKEDTSNGKSSEGGDYGADNLSGLNVQHAATDFEEGKDVILTLTDSNILDEDDSGRAQGISEKDDILENVQLAEMERTKQLEKRKKRAALPVYTGYDDDEFEENAVIGEKKSILSHYDEEKKSGPRMKIGKSGTIVQAAGNGNGNSGIDVDTTGLNNVKNNGGDSKSRIKALHTLTVTKSENDSYVSAEEVAKFKKRAEKKQKKMRLKTDVKEDMKAGNEADSQDGNSLSVALATLKNRTNDATKTIGKGGVSVSSSDHGSRKRRKVVNADVESQINKEKQYNLVAAQATEKSLSIFNSDADIVKQMEQARAVALDTMGNGADAGAAWVKANVKEEKDGDDVKMEEEEHVPNFDEALDADGKRRSDGKMIFSNATEFATRLKEVKVEEEEKVKAEEKDEIDDFAGVEDMDTEEQEEEVAAARNVGQDIIQHAPKKPTGMAATLAMLKESGELNAKERVVGRARDDKGIDSGDTKEFEVKYEHRDAEGRLLTKKEAFRQLNYAFHGIEPGKKAKEKRQKKREQEAALYSNKEAHVKKSLNQLTEAQRATGSAGVEIGKKIV